MRKTITILACLQLCFFASCSSSDDSLEETQIHIYTYDVAKAKTAFYNGVASLTEEFLINRAIVERQGNVKSSFFNSYPKSNYSSGYVLYGFVYSNDYTQQYRKDIIVTFDEKTGTYFYRTY